MKEVLLLDLFLKSPADSGSRPDPSKGIMRYVLKDVDPDGKGFLCYRVWIPGPNAPTKEYRDDHRDGITQTRFIEVTIPTLGGGKGNIKVWDVHTSCVKDNDLLTGTIINEESDNPGNPDDAFSVDISEFEATALTRIAQDIVTAHRICRDSDPHDSTLGRYASLSIELQRSLIDIVEVFIQQIAGELREQAGYPYEYDHPGHQPGAEERTDIATADRWDRIQHEHGPEDQMPTTKDDYARLPLKLHDDDDDSTSTSKWLIKYGVGYEGESLVAEGEEGGAA